MQFITFYFLLVGAYTGRGVGISRHFDQYLYSIYSEDLHQKCHIHFSIKWPENYTNYWKCKQYS